MSLRRLVVTLGLAATGVSCAKAVNYLDPSGPLYSTPRAETAAAPTEGRPLRVVSFNIAYAIEIDRAIEVLRETEALRDPDVLALQEMDAPGTERIARALGMNAVYFPSGVHPKHRSRLRVRDPVALAARGAAKDPAAARRPGLGPAALGGLGRGRPWGAADPRLLAAPAFAPGHLGRLAQGGAAGDRRGRGLGGRAGRHRWRLQLPRQGRGAREGRLPLGHQGPGRHGAAGRPGDRAGRASPTTTC